MKKLSRRAFVKHSAITSAGFMIIPNLKKYSPNQKLNLAFIGVGGRGGRNIKSCLMKDENGMPTNNVVALM